MSNPIFAALTDQVTATVGVMQSAEVALNGFAARMQAAVDKAIADGASAADLAGVQAEIDAMKAESATLATAVAANS